MSCAFCKVNSVSSYGGCPVHCTYIYLRKNDVLVCEERLNENFEINIKVAKQKNMHRT